MNSVRVAESIRIAIGLMTYMDEIGILFTGDAVWALGGLKPEKGTTMATSLDQVEKFISYGQKVLADRESCDNRSVAPAIEGVKVVGAKEAIDAISKAKHVVTM